MRESTEERVEAIKLVLSEFKPGARMSDETLDTIIMKHTTIWRSDYLNAFKRLLVARGVIEGPEMGFYYMPKQAELPSASKNG